MLKIGDFSRLCNISIRMLRYYDEQKLLVPTIVDENNNYRYYSSTQVEVAGKILKLKELGFSTSVINEMLDSKDIQHLDKMFQIRKKELEEETKMLQRQSILLQHAESILNDTASLERFCVNLKMLPKRKMMRIRKTIASYTDEHAVWNMLYAESKRQKIRADRHPIGMTVYHDTEYKSEEIDIEVRSSVEELAEDGELATYFEMDQLEVASVMFQGDYNQMPLVSQAVAKWLDVNGYEMDGAMLMIFHISPAHDLNPDHWVSEACYQVRKR